MMTALLISIALAAPDRTDALHQTEQVYASMKTYRDLTDDLSVRGLMTTEQAKSFEAFLKAHKESLDSKLPPQTVKDNRITLGRTTLTYIDPTTFKAVNGRLIKLKKGTPPDRTLEDVYKALTEKSTASIFVPEANAQDFSKDDPVIHANEQIGWGAYISHYSSVLWHDGVDTFETAAGAKHVIHSWVRTWFHNRIFKGSIRCGAHGEYLVDQGDNYFDFTAAYRKMHEYYKNQHSAMPEDDFLFANNGRRAPSVQTMDAVVAAEAKAVSDMYVETPTGDLAVSGDYVKAAFRGEKVRACDPHDYNGTANRVYELYAARGKTIAEKIAATSDPTLDEQPASSGGSGKAR